MYDYTMDQYHTTIEQVQRDRAVTIGPVTLERERYQYFEEPKNGETSYQRQVLNHYHEDTPLNQLFFSKKNIDALQIQIRKGVYDKSGGEFVINNQDETELLLIMRGIYLQHSVNNPNCDTIIQQIKTLNALVVNEAVPMISSQILAYKIYLKDASTLYNERPIPHPIATNNAGLKTYSFTNFF